MRQSARDLLSGVSPILVVVVLIAVLVIPASIFLIGRGDKSPRPQAQPTVPTSQSGTPSAPASTTPSSTESTNGCEAATDLDTRVRCFVEAWYLLPPSIDYITEVKRASVQPYATDSFMKLEADGMVVETTSMADQARIDDKTTYSADASGEILSEPYEGSSNTQRVFMAVPLLLSEGSGSPEPYLTAYVEMLWSNTDGTWCIDQIDDVAGEP